MSATAVTDTELDELYGPIFDDLSTAAVENDQRKELPYDAVNRLKAAGFGALRVPREDGGGGANFVQLTRQFARLARSDASVSHVFRATLGFTEMVLASPDPDFRARWLPAITRGDFFGAGVTEAPGVAVGTTSTRLVPSGDGYLLTADKRYSTGNRFADWFLFFVPGADGLIGSIVPASASGLIVEDTWNGFGQRVSSTGRTVANEVRVPDEYVFPITDAGGLSTGWYQYALVVTLSGIARRALDEAIFALQTRSRTYAHGWTVEPRQDPLLLEVIGRAAAKVHATETTIEGFAHAVHEAERREPGASPQERERVVEELHARLYQTQLLASDAALDVTTRVFDSLGASATDLARGLDRHWRNARTVSSHNPLPYRARDIGNYYVNGVSPIVPIDSGEVVRDVSAADPARTFS